MSGNPPPISPLYMWAGGKTKLLKAYDPLLPNLSSYTTYVEPFFGGGALYCDLSNRFPHLSSVVNDINPELVGLLRAIRDDEEFLGNLTPLVDAYLTLPSEKTVRKTWYYEQRRTYWADPTPERLYLLMRLGFNGIWQTCKESNGLFGTPAGLLNQVRREQIVKAGLIEAWREHLSNAAITSGDYSAMEFPLGDSTFVYCDPPYRDSFTTYGVAFDDGEQERLVQWLHYLVDQGCTVAMSNRTVEGESFFEDLMGDAFTFHYIPVTYTAGRRKRVEGGFEAKPAVEFLAVSNNATRREAPAMLL